jgi:hypothetical protein
VKARGQRIMPYCHDTAVEPRVGVGERTGYVSVYCDVERGK